MKAKSILFMVAVLSLVVIVGTGTAHANSIATLNGCTPISGTGFTGGCGTGPYGTVTLTQNGSNVNVTVSLDSGYYFTDSVGAGKSIYFDLPTALDITNSDITDVTSGFSVDGAGGPGNSIGGTYTTGTGSWNYAIECGDVACPGGAGGSSADATTLSFTVDGVTVSDFIQNGDDYYFASSVFTASAGDASSQTTANALTPVSTPEPSSLLLLGTGLLALLGIGWRRNSRVASGPALL